MAKSFKSRIKEAIQAKKFHYTVETMVTNGEIELADACEIVKLPKKKQLKYANAASLMKHLREVKS